MIRHIMQKDKYSSICLSKDFSVQKEHCSIAFSSKVILVAKSIFALGTL